MHKAYFCERRCAASSRMPNFFLVSKIRYCRDFRTPIVDVRKNKLVMLTFQYPRNIRAIFGYFLNKYWDICLCVLSPHTERWNTQKNGHKLVLCGEANLVLFFKVHFSKPNGSIVLTLRSQITFFFMFECLKKRGDS